MLSLVARMRQFRIRKIPERIHFRLSCRRIGRIYLYEAAADRFDQNRLGKHIGCSLYQMEILCKSLFILAATLIRMQYDSIFLTASSMDRSFFSRTNSRRILVCVP